MQKAGQYMAIDTTSAMQDYLAALDELAYGKKTEKPAAIENESVQEEQPSVGQSASETELESKQELDEASSSEQTSSNPPEETFVIDPLPVPEPEPEPKLEPEPKVNPAQAYRIAPPPGYKDSVMAIGVE